MKRETDIVIFSLLAFWSALQMPTMSFIYCCGSILWLCIIHLKSLLWINMLNVLLYKNLSMNDKAFWLTYGNTLPNGNTWLNAK
jgi:hypothetical protein